MAKTMTEVDLYADYIDVRDIIARVEELREERESCTMLREDGTEEVDPQGWVDQNEDEAEELTTLEAILDDLKGNGGDEQWEGSWYPVSLIRDSNFETAMDEMLEDIGDLPKDIPSYLKIVVDYDALQMDYTSVEINGADYWYR